MTILNKLSDRDGFIYEVILLIVRVGGNMDMMKLQYELLKCGVYVKKPLLEQALLKLKEEGKIGNPKPTIATPPIPKIIMP